MDLVESLGRRGEVVVSGGKGGAGRGRNGSETQNTPCMHRRHTTHLNSGTRLSKKPPVTIDMKFAAPTGAHEGCTAMLNTPLVV